MTDFTATGSIQFDTIASSGLYDITALGAQGGAGAGGYAGGLGAMVSGDVYLAAGSVLEIIVGGAGGISMSYGAGGGGGGGAGIVGAGGNALTSQNGGRGGGGRSGGFGGGGGGGPYGGGGGGGFFVGGYNASSGFGGGGGGGGYGGGGGGSGVFGVSGGGGGGGGSYLNSSLTSTSLQSGVQSGNGDVTITSVLCFYPGTLLATPSGHGAVENLRAGDMVLTTNGPLPVRWVGMSHVSTRFADPLRVLPIRITAGALGEGLPMRDLLLSPDHALFLDGVLIQAGAMVNGTSILREHDVPETFTYYHVELASHELLLAEGVPSESFVDNVERMHFSNWAEHEALGDTAPIQEMPYARVKSRRQMPQAVWQFLIQRARQRVVEAA